MRTLRDADFDQEVLRAEGLVLVDISAAWCSPCKALEAVLEKLGKENEDIDIVKIDVDKNPISVGKLDARNVPCLVFFKSGHEVKRVVGARSKADLQSIIDSL